MIGIDVAENNIRIGQRGQDAAKIVTDRTRSSAGALWPDLQCAASVDPDHRPASRVDLCQVDRRNLQCVAGPRQQARADHDAAADRILKCATELAVFDQRGLGRGSAHVAFVMAICGVSAWPPTTPAAGPLSIMFIGVTAAAWAVVRPPLDCISRSGASMPMRATSAVRVDRYLSTIGL